MRIKLAKSNTMEVGTYQQGNCGAKFAHNCKKVTVYHQSTLHCTDIHTSTQVQSHFFLEIANATKHCLKPDFAP